MYFSVYKLNTKLQWDLRYVKNHELTKDYGIFLCVKCIIMLTIVFYYYSLCIFGDKHDFDRSATQPS